MNSNIEKLANGDVSYLPNSLDFSVFSKYLICPRYYFFRFIMGIIPTPHEEQFPLDLVFGSSWHKGMEEGYKAMKQGVDKLSELTGISIKGFNEKWDEKVPFNVDLEKCFPKIPSIAGDLLDEYWSRYESFHKSIKIIQPEEGFYFPTMKDRPLIHGTIDLIYSDPVGLLTVMEHKTTKTASQLWLDGFDNSFQIEMYSLATFLTHNEVPMVMVNAALIQKRSQDLFRVMLSKRKDAIHRFFEELQHDMDGLCNEAELLIEEIDEGKIQTAFPRRQHACMMYGRKCPYFDVCSSEVAPYKVENFGFDYDVYDIEKMNGEGGDYYS